MEFKSNVNADCCTPTGKYELCGCANGVPYMQLTVVGGGTVQTAWLNTETGDTFTTKPVGFVTGTCQDAALADVLKFSATAPTASAPFAAPKDGDTTIVTSDGTEAGDVVGLFLYDAETSTWKEIPVKTDILWTDVATAPAATGNPVGPRFEITTEGAKYFIDSDGRAEKLDTKIDVNLTPIDYIPAPTGNADNRGEIVVDPAGGVWVIDEEGDAIQLSLPTFKELNRFYVDPNGNDSNTGANEAPKLTAQAAVDALTANDTAVLNEGTYAAVTMSVQNTALAGASSTYGSLSQIAAVTVATASGTSNKISDLTVTGNLARTGNAPLYVNNTTVGGNVTLAGTAYTEIRDSSIQDGGIAVSGAATVLIEDSKIGTSTFSTAGSAIAMRNTTIDATDTVTYGPGVVYSLQDAVGNIVLDPAAVNAEDALIAAGVPAAQAEGAVTSHFMHIRMHNADVELNPTQIVTRDPVTGELEYSPLSAIAPAAPTHERDVFASTAGQTSFTLTKTPVGGTGKVIVTRNGVDISSSFTVSGNVINYDSSANYGCTFDLNDRVIVHYEAAV